MEWIKKVNGLVLGLAVLLTVGCSDKNSGQDDELAPAFTSCGIKKISEDGYGAQYFYNAQGQVIRKDAIPSTNPTIFEYNASGRISRIKSWFVGNEPLNMTEAEYNSDLLLAKETEFQRSAPTDTFSAIRFTLFSYDTSKRLTRKVYYEVNQPNVIQATIDYSYPSAKVMRTITHIRNQATNTLELTSTQEVTYDDKKDPREVLNNLAGNGNIAHNPLSTISTHYLNGAAVSTATTIHTYTYNASGYPTKGTSVTNGSHTIIQEYEYDCQ